MENYPPLETVIGAPKGSFAEHLREHDAKEPAEDRLGATACSPSSETPETDANTYQASTLAAAAPDYIIPVAHADFARRLERERNEAIAALRELSGLCERAWEGMIIGKPIRNDAMRLLRKYSLANETSAGTDAREKTP